MRQFFLLGAAILFWFGGSVLTAETPQPGDAVKRVLSADNEQFGPNRVEREKLFAYRDGFVNAEDGAWRCENGEDAAAHRGAAATIRLEQQKPLPIVATAESRAENVGGSADPNYSIYIDIAYQDGTRLYGQSAPFETGSTDWQKKEVLVYPTKPIQSLSVYTLFRQHTGSATFRNLTLRELTESDSAVVYDTVPLREMKKLAPETLSFQLRDTANRSDFFLLGTEDSDVKSKAFDVALHCRREELDKKTGAAIYFLTLKSESDADRILTLLVSYPVEAKRFFDSPLRAEEIEPGREYLNTVGKTVGSNGRLSRWPFGAVESGTGGVLLGVSPDFPAFCRFGYHEPAQELFLTYDIALTKEKPTADLAFVFSRFDAKDGFGGAYNEYARLFPEAFVRRAPEQGNWMPFAKISEVEGWEDFGFVFKEGTDETAWDDEHQVITFRYTEPMTWWMRMEKGSPRTYEAAFEKVKKLAAEGNRQAEALLTSGHRDENGRYVARMLDTPWCDGAVWSVNDMPGLAAGVREKKVDYSEEYPVAGIEVKWNAEIAEKLYGPKKSDLFNRLLQHENSAERTAQNEKIAADFSRGTPKKGLDGEYIDSSETYLTAPLDFRRDHFPYAAAPLCYDRVSKKPGIYVGLLAFEYARGLSRDVHDRGRLMMANSTPSSLFWLAPWLDVMGTETDWNRSGRWSPMSMDELFYRRVLCGKKPFCFLMNTDFSQWSKEATEKYMKRSLAFGMFPGFFSADASTGHYFKNPDLYHRDRPLFKKYLPMVKRVAEAGWEAVPLVSSDAEQTVALRFGSDPGERYFTVFNGGQTTKKVTLTFDKRLGMADGQRLVDLVSGGVFHLKGDKITAELGPEETLALHEETR